MPRARDPTRSLQCPKVESTSVPSCDQAQAVLIQLTNVVTQKLQTQYDCVQGTCGKDSLIERIALRVLRSSAALVAVTKYSWHLSQSRTPPCGPKEGAVFGAVTKHF